MHQRHKLRALLHAAHLPDAAAAGDAPGQTARRQLRLRAHAHQRAQHLLHAFAAAQRQQRAHRLREALAKERRMLRQIGAQAHASARQIARQPFAADLRPVPGALKIRLRQRRAALLHPRHQTRFLRGDHLARMRAQSGERILRLRTGGKAAGHKQAHRRLSPRAHAQPVEQAAVDALAPRVAKAVDALRQIGLQHAAAFVRAPHGVPRVVAVTRVERLRNLIVLAHVAAQLHAVLAARRGHGQDVRAHGEGHLHHARRLPLVFHRQLDHAAARAVWNKLAAHDVQLLCLHAVVKRGRRRIHLAGVRAGQRHVVDGEEEAVADLLFTRPQSAHLALDVEAEIGEQSVLRADQHGAGTRRHDGRVQLIVSVYPVPGEHSQPP